MKRAIFFTCFIVLNFPKVGSILIANIYSDISYCHKEFIKLKLESISTNQLDRLNTSTDSHSKNCYRYHHDYHKDYCLQRVLSKGSTTRRHGGNRLIGLSSTFGNAHSIQCFIFNIEIEYSELGEAFQYLQQHQQYIDSNSTIKMIKITFINSPSITSS